MSKISELEARLDWFEKEQEALMQKLVIISESLGIDIDFEAKLEQKRKNDTKQKRLNYAA